MSNFLRTRAARGASRILGLAVSLPLLWGLLEQPASAQQPGNVTPATLEQIAAIVRDKDGRTLAQQKLDSQLIYAAREARGQDAVAAAPALEADIEVRDGGLVLVDITAAVSPRLLAQIVALGGQVQNAFARDNAIRALVPLGAIEPLAARADVRFIQPAVRLEADRMPAPEPIARPSLRRGMEEMGGAKSNSPIIELDKSPGGRERAARGARSGASRLTARPLGALSTNGSLAPPVYGVGGARAEVQLAHWVQAAKAARSLSAQREWTRGSGGSTETGAVTSQGDIAHRADEARATFGVNGTGVKIGVISDSDDALEATQASGDVPANVTVLPGQSGRPGIGEGTAMMEIIHDLAPGAQLYFATANGGQANFANNIRQLQAAGCDIIVDDIRYDNESPFQADVVEQAVYDVSAQGVLYFSSAGNAGNKNDNTAGVWVGDFADGGASPAGIAKVGNLHDFGGGVTANECTGAGRVLFFWSDPLNGSTNDYDVYVTNAAGTVLRSSTTTQNGTQDPYETVNPLNVGDRVVIVKTAGAANRFLYLGTFRGQLAIITDGFQRAHNAAGAANAFSVAATRALDTDFVGGLTNPVETFSSDGPRRIFYNPDGSAITPGNFSASGGTLLQKPDITAADGVRTTSPNGGLNPFFGTSAAAPHAAAIAGLLLSYNPALPPAQVRNLMQSTALDIEADGFDRDSGAGIVMALPALQAAPVPSPRLLFNAQALSGGNGNGLVDPNECLDLNVSLRNAIGNTGSAATGVSATLSSNTPGVTITQTTSAYPNIAATRSALNSTPFQVRVASSFVCGTPVSLSLSVSAANAGSLTIPLQLSSGAAGALTGFESTDVPKNIPDGSGSVDSTVAISNFNGVIGKVTVSLYLTHAWDSDISASLIAPDGTTIRLFANVGDDGDNFGSSSLNRTVLDDDAATSITAGSAPFVGTFRPQQSLAAFKGKTGAAANGTWRLRLADVVAQDPGILVNWALSLAPATCADGGGACVLDPAVSAITAATNEDAPLVFSAAIFDAGFSDPNGGVGTLAKVRVDSLPVAATGTLLLNGVAVTVGQEVVRADLGSLSFAPAANFNGSASFNYNASHGTAYAPTAAAVNITVASVNDVPSFTLAATAEANEDAGAQSTAVATAISKGPADENAQTISFSVTTTVTGVSPAGAALFSSAPSIGSDGTLLFTASPNASGTATLAVRAVDSGGTDRGGVDTSAIQNLALTIRPINDAPTVANSSLGTAEDVPLGITLAASDVDSTGFTFDIVSGPANGTLSGNGGTRTYTPRANFVGSDSFTFRASDGTANSNVATVTVTVGGQNDAPVAQNDTASTSEDVPGSIQVLANDTDDENDALTVKSVTVSPATNGTLSISADKKSVLFTPTANSSGTSTFSYVANDGSLDSSPATVTVQVLAANDAPVAVADSYRVTGRSLSINATAGVLANDADVEGDALQALLASVPAHGSVTLNGDGSFTYTPAETYIGADSFSYVARDAIGQSAPAVVSLRVVGSITLRDNTPPLVSLAGAATRTLRALPTIRGSAVDRYAVPGRGVVAASGLKSVVVRLQNASGQFFNGRTFGSTASDLATRQVGRSFFELARSMPIVVPEGRYTITAIATDNSNNTARATQTVLVDSTPPSLDITTPASGANNTATVARLSSIGGRASGAVRVEVALRNSAGQYFNGTGFAGQTVFLPATLGGVGFSLSLPPGFTLPPGRYLILARAVDAAGNPANKARIVVVQSSAAR